MKKIFLLIGLLLFFSSITQAKTSSISEPQWEDFCPSSYTNATMKTIQKSNKKNMENNYWAARRVEFIKSVEECKILTKENSRKIGACYLKIVQTQRKENLKRNNIKDEQNANSQMQIVAAKNY